MSFHIEAAKRAKQQFTDCDLGDQRRTKRLIRMAEQAANHPSASFPEQMESCGDLKAAYRLFDCEDVTFEAIAGPHWQQTRAVPPGRYLVLGDTTEIDFGYRREISGLKPIGNGNGRGFLLHNAFKMPVPRHKSPYLKALKPDPIPMTVVWVREVDAPRGVKPIEWVLSTSLPVTTFDDAWLVVEYYEWRWLIEEYHKALKTGCSVQRRLLRDSKRLEAMIGLMSVVAVRLLQLKSIARSDPDRPARKVVPSLWLQMLKAARKKLRRVHDLSEAPNLLSTSKNVGKDKAVRPQVRRDDSTALTWRSLVGLLPRRAQL